MPYLSYAMHCYKTDHDGTDVVSNKCGNIHCTARRNPPDQRQSEDSDRRRYNLLLDCYEGEAIHRSSTLDEWYYHFRSGDPRAQEERRHRNKTQVVTKASPQDKNSCHWPLIRVNQVWLWTLDESMYYYKGS